MHLCKHVVFVIIIIIRCEEDQERDGIHDSSEFFTYDGHELHRGDCCNSLTYWLWCSPSVSF